MNTEVLKRLRVGEKLAAGSAISDNLLGGTFTGRDMDRTAGNVKFLSNLDVNYRVVKNGGSTALKPGSLVKNKLGPTSVEQCGADGVVSGIVDPALTSDVAVGEVFLVVYEGPTKFLVGGSNTALNDLIKSSSAGAGLVSALAVGPLSPIRALAVGTANTLCRCYVNCGASV